MSRPLLLVLLAMLSLPAAARAAQSDTTCSRSALVAQLATVNRELDDAQSKLTASPAPSTCCCIGSFILFPIGPLFWYFMDIKPKNDKRHQLEERIQTLTNERQLITTQLMMMQKS